MIYLIVAGGPVKNIPSLSSIQTSYEKSEVRWIGVDRGVYYLLKEKIDPDFAFGDFDSLSDKERGWIEEKAVHLKVYPEQKDETDLEIAVNWALQQKPDKIVIYGGTGGRLDHLFVNAQLLLKGLDKKIPIILEDRWNKMFLKSPGAYTVKSSNARYVSFLPMSDSITGLTLKKFRYPLENAFIKQGSSLCISNELIADEGFYSFEKGLLMVFQTNDQS
ncbi:thiamine diphosphokinase [Evansella halocellulosilytica]|uniref:thiamine diphosphokinase n=1 Tax=Evansella halocellulosilytica TaxID=2011013 RepID=UPI000BB702F7|nr:thiamine diphosphokinase [Evansella halocellulosilytica]